MGATKFAEHEKQIRMEEFTSGIDKAQIHFENQLNSISEDLNTQHEEKIQHVLADILECQQEWRDEEYVQAFALGCTTGIQDEHESARASQVDVGIQVRPTTATNSVQTNPPIISLSSTASISTQTKPPILFSKPFEPSIPIHIPIPISEPPVSATIPPTPFNWAANATSFSTIPTIPPKTPQDLSSLRSTSKNPFSSLIITTIQSINKLPLHINIPNHIQLVHLLIPSPILIGIVIHAFLSLATF